MLYILSLQNYFFKKGKKEVSSIEELLEKTVVSN